MRYLTDAERRDFVDIIKSYINEKVSGNPLYFYGSTHRRGTSFKPFMLTTEVRKILGSMGEYGIDRGYWGHASVKERGVICRNMEEGLPIFLATKVPAYGGVMLRERDGNIRMISFRDTIPFMTHNPRIPHNSWEVSYALAAIHILENANKVSSKMLIEMPGSNYDEMVSILETPVRYLSISIKPVARLDDPERLEPPFYGHFDSKHEHLLEDLIRSKVLDGGSLIFDAVEIVRAKWIKKERFADMFHVMKRSPDVRQATDLVVAWEFDTQGLPPGRLALDLFDRTMHGSGISLSEVEAVEAVLEGDRVVDQTVLGAMARFYQQSFEGFYERKYKVEPFFYEGRDRIVDPRK